MPRPTTTYPPVMQLGQDSLAPNSWCYGCNSDVPLHSCLVAFNETTLYTTTPPSQRIHQLLKPSIQPNKRVMHVESEPEQEEEGWMQRQRICSIDPGRTRTWNIWDDNSDFVRTLQNVKCTNALLFRPQGLSQCNSSCSLPYFSMAWSMEVCVLR